MEQQEEHDGRFYGITRLTLKRCLEASMLCGLLLTLSTGRRLYAQQALRDLSGSVADAHREPLRGAVVYLENEATHSVLTFITDRSGRFSFKRLQSDVDYDVWATFRNQNSKRKTLSQFNTHVNPAITLVIKLE